MTKFQICETCVVYGYYLWDSSSLHYIPSTYIYELDTYEGIPHRLSSTHEATVAHLDDATFSGIISIYDIRYPT